MNLRYVGAKQPSQHGGERMLQLRINYYEDVFVETRKYAQHHFVSLGEHFFQVECGSGTAFLRLASFLSVDCHVHVPGGDFN